MYTKVKEIISDADERKAIQKQYRWLLKNARLSQNEKDQLRIRKAFDVALEAHKGIRRRSGEPYIFHPIAVARIVAEEIGLGTTSIVCALLHDVVEDTQLTIKDIENLFGPTEAKIIEGLTKIDEVFVPEASKQVANYRKIILTLADDVRVILIKLADRLHNMRTLDAMPRDKLLRIASETLYIYTPLAHRLGLYNLKSELEDLALKHKSPHLYNDILGKLKKDEAVRKRFIRHFTLPIRNALDKAGIKYRIHGRPKSIYSIWTKMREQGVPFEGVYDVFAIRIIIDTPEEIEKAECWKVYSIVTDFYKPNPDRLRDWISTPKANGYESLHTTVMSPGGRWVEVQIRSERMDAVAERGLAAHWRYKDKSQDALDEWMQRVREVLESADSDPVDFVDDFKLNLFAKEIFVFTPKGEIKAMPHNSTVLDFAYEIHSEIGMRAIGGKVGQKMVPISYTLNSGDQVQVITSKAQKPEPDWLNFVVTAKARTAIRSYLKKERKRIERKGRTKINKALKKYGLSRSEHNYEKLALYFRSANVEDLFYKAGMDALYLNRIYRLKSEKGKIMYRPRKKRSLTIDELVQATTGKKKELVIGNTTNFNFALATCCHPIPGDDVVGFLTNEGIMEVHRVSCQNTIDILSKHSYKAVKTRWDTNETLSFLAGIIVSGFDRKGIVNEMTKVISSDMHVNIRSINIESNDGMFTGKITVFVNDTKHLRALKDKLRAIKGITKVNRLE